MRDSPLGADHIGFMLFCVDFIYSGLILNQVQRKYDFNKLQKRLNYVTSAIIFLLEDASVNNFEEYKVAIKRLIESESRETSRHMLDRLNTEQVGTLVKRGI